MRKLPAFERLETGVKLFITMEIQNTHPLKNCKVNFLLILLDRWTATRAQLKEIYRDCIVKNLLFGVSYNQIRHFVYIFRYSSRQHEQRFIDILPRNRTEKYSKTAEQLWFMEFLQGAHCTDKLNYVNRIFFAENHKKYLNIWPTEKMNL